MRMEFDWLLACALLFFASGVFLLGLALFL